jgi:hypothetical protein
VVYEEDGFARKKINELITNERVEIEGIVTGILKPSEYTGCPVCFRKNCGHVSDESANLTKLYIPRFWISDGSINETQGIIASFPPTKNMDVVDIRELDEVLLKGKTSTFMGRIVFNVWKFELVNRKS